MQLKLQHLRFQNALKIAKLEISKCTNLILGPECLSDMADMPVVHGGNLILEPKCVSDVADMHEQGPFGLWALSGPSSGPCGVKYVSKWCYLRIQNAFKSAKLEISKCT